MGRKDPRLDVYIANAGEFARPILQHLRRLVHAACPDVEETMKWSFPHFDYKGMMCSMAAFKQHCSFGFWKGALILDERATRPDGAQGMGQFGRITALSDLPADKVLTGYIKKAVELNDSGVKLPARPKAKENKTLTVSPALAKAFKKNKKAQTTFENFSYSHKKEYIEWIDEAKTEETRQRRVDTALEWLAQGKPRNWKYLKK
jgi:uncharacterized protein YdeI (YjbR/CyaY-like superfamily)